MTTTLHAVSLGVVWRLSGQLLLSGAVACRSTISIRPQPLASLHTPVVCTYGWRRCLLWCPPACVCLLSDCAHTCLHTQADLPVFRPIYIVAAASSNQKAHRAGWDWGPHRPCMRLPEPQSAVPLDVSIQSPCATPAALNLCLLLLCVCMLTHFALLLWGLYYSGRSPVGALRVLPSPVLRSACEGVLSLVGWVAACWWPV